MEERRLQISLILLLLAVALLLNFFIFLPYLSLLFLAGVFAVIFKPLHGWSAKRVANRTSASFLTMFIILIGILLPIIVFGFLIFREATQVYFNLAGGGLDNAGVNQSIATVENYLQSIFPGANLELASYIEQGLAFLVSHLDSFFSGLIKTIFTFFLLMLGLFYLFRDGKEIKNGMIRISPLSDEQDKLLFSRLEAAINSVVRGFLVVALIQGILTGVGFAIFGIPAPLLWGVVASVAALVPSVGTALVIVPGILFLFFSGNVMAALGLLVWGVAAVGLVDNILGPILIRRGLPVHPFVILLSVLGGISFFGPIGFLAGPVMVSVLVALFELSPRVMAQK